jgi:hypothetical protein
MGDFLVFRRMLLPVLIQLIFWLAVLSSIAFGLAVLFDQAPGVDLKAVNAQIPSGISASVNEDTLKAVIGLYFCLINPIFIRLTCELLILPFRINGTLTDIRNALLRQEEAAERGAGHNPLPQPQQPRPAGPPRR